MSSNPRKPQNPQNPQQPSKLFYRIGEIGNLTGLEPYVLRYWETEFPQIKPDKGGSGHRLYRKQDLEVILQIKNLLYKEGFTIAGARKKLNGRSEPDRAEIVESAKRELRDILKLLK